MWQSEELLNHIETSSTVRGTSFVTAEINLNVPSNILRVGNYRYRPFEKFSKPLAEQSPYSSIQNAFSIFDEGRFYTDATDADVVVDGGFEDASSGTPTLFKTKKDKEKMLYSLEDCFGRFRPRSGVNKLRYLETDWQYLNSPGEYSYLRPRYYMAHKDDPFKYWTSYRTEDGQERGIAIHFLNNRYYIDDVAPFVVYKKQVASNRIVVKMQTGIGNINLGPFKKASESFDDPFFGQENASVPVRWSIQYLENNNWLTAYSFDENSVRKNGQPIIGPDGYVEIYYGLKIPVRYRDTYFKHAGEFSSEYSLPSQSISGYAYLVGASESSPGKYWVWNGESYDTPFTPEYAWQVKDEGEQNDYGFVRDLTNPSSFINPLTSKLQYREFQYLSGVRLVVETMNKNDAVFDLIEISPRLSIDMTDRMSSFTLTKPASDLGVSGLPVGQLLAGTGTASIFDYDLAFVPNNPDTIIADFWSQSMQLKFYEVIQNVEGFDYYVPIKTMYTEGFPQIDSKNRSVDLTLRDLYFYLENTTAPQLFVQNVSLGIAVATILDYIGFTNYIFYRLDNESDPVIPSFFIKPDQSVAEVLQQLAISTQYTMFFDEYNNLVIMSRNYLMPTEEQRKTDLQLLGSNDSEKTGILQNSRTQDKLANIIEVSSTSNKVFNGGTIKYTSRYIQKSPSYSNLYDSLLEQDQLWVYDSAQLWDVASEKSGRLQQNGITVEDSLVLAAMPLNSDLNDKHPYVSGNRMINNTIDIGESIFFISRYNGYLYANGEIIRYDAVQYSIPGLSPETGDLVWISSYREYERYFSNLPFSGKMYPTGLLRIFSEPYYDTINGVVIMRSGDVAKSGRCQFGTGALGADGATVPVYHSAGISSYWIDNANVRGVTMESEFLFGSRRYRSSEFIVTNAKIIGSLAEITVNQNHDFVKGDTVYIENVNAIFDGEHIISSTTSNKINFALSAQKVQQAIDAGFIEESVDSIFSVAYVSKFDSPNSSISAGANNGTSNLIALRSSRNGIIKNYLGSSVISENDAQRLYATQSGTVQSSALVFSGGTYSATESPIDHVSYVYKRLNNAFTHFGTRLRIIGKQENDELRLQTPVGVMKFYGVQEVTPQQLATIGGASAGMSIMVDPVKNTGYYFEIAALTADNVTSYVDSTNVHDVLFYKVVGSNGKAVPVKLWGGYAGILTNSGEEVGQARIVAEENPSVYDLAIEYQDIGSTRRFYLYLNNSLIQIVDDTSPLPIVNNVALFVRGSSRGMFENIYALTENYSQNTAASLNLPSNRIFANSDNVSSDSAFRKYAISGIVQSSYLSSISLAEPPAYSIYYDEFGTIMREAAYFNVRYDKAYPALLAYLLPNVSRLKGYTISGFMAGSYGAEFLMFNATDSLLLLDNKENSLMIGGVTFTQENNQEYSVDDYFSKVGSSSNPPLFDGDLILSPDRVKEEYFQIKSSRIQYGKNEFNLSLPYLQSTDEADSLMEWLVDKIMKPRLSIGLKIFPNPMIQLGDIVTVDLTSSGDSQFDILVSKNVRFVVYNIEYSVDPMGPEMTIYLSEVK
jgi:hypothetical protein